MLRRIVDAVGKLVRTPPVRVGEDGFGNVYYVVRQANHADRRVVKYAGEAKNGQGSALVDYDPHAIPVEWQSWLNGRRKEPPTAAESAQLAEFRATVKQRAKEWDAEDQKMRLRELVKRRVDDHEGGGPHVPDASHPHQQHQQHQQDHAANAKQTPQFKAQEWSMPAARPNE
ncbi:mitochondrial Complex I (CI) assembly protein B17.2L/NDUFAF2/mimitin [Andalucia godoyi]|uniref:Mitochondrial Complex I (CI) assembly protein B17.2L/NDUFAF2/mimitin n=1 Tax=Andalucia godoyi TaxID=505711 RepID=A0A8K0AIW0_ANDGO|nr:mitochondrial Complex I (CI) assembly protein B17.2L/NDUFAF2/mimitin [Andalucia godoyi]|eukprot:ANDGO_08504.mRNA.1 mitochondrial Complex I (CI) assembly protein B17.2L/NDUFAF2/mimitin